LWLAAAVVAAQLLASGTWVETVAGTPQVRVKTDVIDLGTIAMGDPAEARFELENVGDGVLEIYRVESG
jgi:hypothetical protein